MKSGLDQLKPSPHRTIVVVVGGLTALIKSTVHNSSTEQGLTSANSWESLFHFGASRTSYACRRCFYSLLWFLLSLMFIVKCFTFVQPIEGNKKIFYCSRASKVFVTDVKLIKSDKLKFKGRISEDQNAMVLPLVVWFKTIMKKLLGKCANLIFL